MDNNIKVTSNIGFFGVLFFIFLVLKLGVGHTGVMNWSWWLVTAPLWGPLIIVLLMILLIFLVSFLIVFFSARTNKK